MKIKAVLWDLDNTLLDFMRMKRTAVEIAVDYMLGAGLKGKRNELIEKIFQIYRQTHIESQSALETLIQQQMGKKFEPRILASGIIGYQRGRDLATYPYPGVEKVLKELLRMGLLLGTVSDAPAEQCYNRLARLHLIPWLDVIVTYDDTKEYKPSPKPFLLALKKLKLAPKNVVYVGDWPEKDIVGAKKIGMITVFARWGEHPDAPDTGADYDTKNVLDIVKIVNQLNKKQ